MMTLLHVSIALTSVVYLAALLFSAKLFSSKTRRFAGFGLAYASVVATLGSGIVLIVTRPDTMAHVCVSGTVYLMVATAAITFAKYRQAKYFTA